VWRRYGDGVRFRERVQVPLSWWVFAVLFAATLALAFGFYLGAGVALAVGLPALVCVALGFWTSSYVIEVDDEEVRVGRAVIGRAWIGGVRPLDAAGSRVRAEVEADARAHLVLRPWVPTTVEIVLDDPADPVPYWLVSTRRPGAFAGALGWLPEPATSAQDIGSQDARARPRA
jgi:DUF3093 family protein